MDSSKIFTYHLIPVKFFPSFLVFVFNRGLWLLGISVPKSEEWPCISFPLMHHYCLMPVILFRGDKEGNTNYVLHMYVSLDVCLTLSEETLGLWTDPSLGITQGT